MSESSQLGFHNLPFLAHRKSVKRGFEFTLMVVGKCLCLVAWWCSASRFASGFFLCVCGCVGA